MTPNRRRPSLARRALPALVLTGASGFLLSALDHPANTASASSGLPKAGSAPKTSTVPKTGTGATTPTTTARQAPQPGGPPPGGNDDGPGAGQTGGQTATPATTKQRTTTTTAASAVPAAPGGDCTTKTGPVVNTRFGPVQVQASVSADGTTICSVDAIQTPNDRRRSVLINQQAVPMLNDQVMQAQSAQIDGVSGATITSNAYDRSLQAILDGKGT